MLIVGPSESGKTAMFHKVRVMALCVLSAQEVFNAAITMRFVFLQLNTGRNVETVTSMKPGVLHYESSQGPLEMIDFPGHQRLQGYALPSIHRSVRFGF